MASSNAISRRHLRHKTSTNISIIQHKPRSSSTNLPHANALPLRSLCLLPPLELPTPRLLLPHSACRPRSEGRSLGVELEDSPSPTLPLSPGRLRPKPASLLGEQTQPLEGSRLEPSRGAIPQHRGGGSSTTNKPQPGQHWSDQAHLCRRSKPAGGLSYAQISYLCAIKRQETLV